jgi:hypothetical protein
MFPSAAASRQMMLGMEVLHLTGNGIFLTSLGCLYCCVRSRWIRWTLYMETFHLYEHLMLTFTAYFVGKPIGLSTLFGSSVIGSQEFAVGCRVTWHFAMNLLPMPFAMIGLMEHISDQTLDRVTARGFPRRSSAHIVKISGLLSIERGEHAIGERAIRQL